MKFKLIFALYPVIFMHLALAQTPAPASPVTTPAKPASTQSPPAPTKPMVQSAKPPTPAAKSTAPSAKVSATPAPSPKDPALLAHYHYGFFLGPSSVSSTLTLNSTGTQFKLSGFSPLNPTLYGQYYFENLFSIYGNVSYPSFSINSGTVDTFSLVSSKTSFVSGELLLAKCFLLSDSSLLCPRVGALYSSDYILEFQSNTALNLAKISDLMIDVGVGYEIPLNQKGLKLNLGVDYQIGTGTGQSSETIIQSYNNFHAEATALFPLGNPRFNLLAGLMIDIHKGVFSITQDQWNQSLTQFSGVVGLQINSAPPSRPKAKL